MNSKGLRFLFRMQDAFSRPAQRAIGLFTRLQKLMNGLNRSSRGGGVGFFAALSQGAKGFLGVLNNVRRSVFSLQGLLATGLVLGLGSGIVKSGTFGENTKTAFSLLTGSSAKGQQVLEQAVSFAAKTPFETSDVIGAYQRLLKSGFSLEQISPILAGVSDVAALSGFDPQLIDQILRAMGQIKSKGKLQGDEVLQLAEAGVPAGKIYEVLAEKLGMTTDEVYKLQAAGKITSDMGIFAILEAIRTTVSGGVLGKASDAFSKTLSGLTSTVKSRPLELMLGFDESAGYKSLKGFMGNLANLLDPKSKNGARIKSAAQGMFSSIFSTLFGPLEQVTRDDVASAWIEKFLDKGEKFVAWFNQNWPTILQYAQNFGTGFKQGFTEVWNALEPLVGLFAKFQSPLDSTNASVATAIGRFLPWALAIGAVSSVLSPLMSLIGGVGGAGGIIGLLTKLNPWVLAVAAGFGLLYTFSDKFREAVNGLPDTLARVSKAIQEDGFWSRFAQGISLSPTLTQGPMGIPSSLAYALGYGTVATEAARVAAQGPQGPQLPAGMQFKTIPGFEKDPNFVQPSITNNYNLDLSGLTTAQQEVVTSLWQQMLETVNNEAGGGGSGGGR